MADFELNINERAFDLRGVRVNFDENRYGTLLDELVERTPIEAPKTPRVNVSPAPVWGMSRTREILSMAAQDHNAFPTSYYSPATHSLSVSAGKDESEANHLLLFATRRWAGDLNGELAEATVRSYEKRLARKGMFATIIGGAAFAGFEFGDSVGAVVGGVVGMVGSLATDMANDHRDPYHRAIRDFVKDPQVMAEFGQIMSYEQA